jgi:preprotein translocase subunit SecA
MDKEKLLFYSSPIALVDEADAILIDEARIPLVLTGSAVCGPSMMALISAIPRLSLCVLHGLLQVETLT